MDAQCYVGDFLPQESQLDKNYTRLLVGAFKRVEEGGVGGVLNHYADLRKKKLA